MITRVKAYSSWANATPLPLADPGRIETDLLQITNISGLEPVKAAINTSQFANVDGGAFTGSNLPVRNIVLTIKPNPDWADWTPETLRKLLYLYFQPKLPVQLVFEDSVKPPVSIFGYTESNEPNIFTKDGTIQVSIICPYPYFTTVDPIVVHGTSVNIWTPQTITYNGDVEGGIVVEVDAHSGQPVPSSISIQTQDPAIAAFTMAEAEEIDTNQYVTLSSVPGNKYADAVRIATGTVVSLLSRLNTGYKWPTLQPGDNQFAVITDQGHHDWTLTYYERFGGL